MCVVYFCNFVGKRVSFLKLFCKNVGMMNWDDMWVFLVVVWVESLLVVGLVLKMDFVIVVCCIVWFEDGLGVILFVKLF